MPIVLFTLLAIAVCITIAGLILSSRSTVRNQREISYAQRTTRPENEPQRTHRRTPNPQARTRHISPKRATQVHVTFGQRLLSGGLTSWGGITLVLLSICFLGIYALPATLHDGVLLGAPNWLNLPAAPQTGATTTPVSSDLNYSQLVIRIGQLELAQYNSKAEYDTWAYSACSAAAMAEVMNAYGHHYRVTDVLTIESQIGEITPQLGLLDPGGIQRTVARFGFQTAWGMKMSLDQLIATANNGRPVIVSFPPETYAGGHIVVVTGGDSSFVFMADSSLYNRHAVTRNQFMQWWRGYVAIVTPKP